jgi:hypothetical protein
MKDMQAQLEKILEQIAECGLIASQASDKIKRDLFAELSLGYGALAREVERAIQKMQQRDGKVSN